MDFGCHFLRSGEAATGGFRFVVGAGSGSGLVAVSSGGAGSEAVGGVSFCSGDGAGALGCHFLRSGVEGVGATSAAGVAGTGGVVEMLGVC
jgi:hypothetical protein